MTDPTHQARAGNVIGHVAMANKRHIWCLMAKPSTLYDADHLEMPARCLSLLRPGTDICLVPGSNEAMREYAEFCKEVFGLADWQVVYTDDTEESFALPVQPTRVGDYIKMAIASGSQSSVQCLAPNRSEWAILPYTHTLDLKELAAVLNDDLPDHSFDLCGEDPAWMAQFGSKAILFRSIKKLDEPCLIEKANPDIKVPRGYVCNQVNDLLVAFRLLTDGQEDASVWLKPTRSSQGVILVTSANELKYYDFPLGEVIMQENLWNSNEDTKSDNQALSDLQISPCVQYSGNAILEGDMFERIMVGNASYGIRNCTPPNDSFLKTITSWSTDIVKAIAPTTSGTFTFTSVNGEPLLVDAAPGGVSMEHFCRMFINFHAPGKCFSCWNLRPTQGQDVWSVWTKLCDRDIAFLPLNNKIKKGVFPVLFLRNTSATLIAVGDTDEEVADLRKVADEVFSTPETITIMKNVALKESNRRIWVHAPRPEYQRQTQRYNLPARILSLVRKGKDLIILQGGHEPTREYWEFCKDILDLDEDQAIFTEGEIFNLDDDIDNTIVAKLRQIIASSDDEWTLVPYGVTYKFDRWASQLADLGVAVFGETLDWVTKYGHKGILHRHMKNLDQPCEMELIDPNIRVAKGYTCSDNDDLIKAYELIGQKDVVIKPVFGAAGEGIMFVSSVEELRIYDFCMGDVCLEEFLSLDKAPDGLVLSPAMHYNEGVLIGKGLVDQIMVGTSYMGWRVSSAPKAFQGIANRYMQTMLEVMKPAGPGGVDFLSVNGLPVLSDINTGRFNGAHGPKLFMAAYAPTKAFYCWKAIPALHVSIYSWWKKLLENGIAFIPGKTPNGVFPLLFLRGLSGMYISVHDTAEQAEKMAQQAQNLLITRKAAAELGFKVPVTKPSIFKKADIMRKSANRLWATSSGEMARRVRLRLECSARPACLLRPGKDIILLQGNNDGLKDYFEFLKETVGLEDKQVVWTQSKATSLCLDNDIDDDVLAQLRERMADYNADSPSLCLPMEVSDNFLRWANKMDNIKVFGEDPTWINEKGNAACMHRTIKNVDQPCLLETTVPNLKRIQGYIATNSNELLKAQELLGGKKCVCVPIMSMDGRGSTTINSVSEAQLYSFPDGDIIVREVAKMDKSADGLPIIVAVTYLKSEIFGTGFTDIVKLGSTNNGLRESVTSDEFQDQVSKLARAVLKTLNPQGPGAMDFGCVDGKPVLIRLQTNRFTPTHVAKLFLEEYAPAASFAVWNFHPPDGVDVWTFWSRLTERNAEFTPGVSTRGVFPLLFLKNDNALGSGTFIAIGTDAADVEVLKGLAEEALREVSSFVNLPDGISLSQAYRRVWAHSPKMIKDNNPARYAVPSRVLCMMRQGLDMAVLPGNHEPTREFWDFCKSVLRLKSSQVIFTSGESADMDDDLDDETISRLKATVVGSRAGWTLVPNTIDAKFRSWSQALVEGLGVSVFGDDEEWNEKWGSKAILHRHIQKPDEKSIIETIDPNIRVAKGFVVSSLEDAQKAYGMMDCKEVVIKPVNSIRGEGITMCPDIGQLELMQFDQDMIIEEFLQLDKAPDGLVLSAAIHFSGNKPIGKTITDQILVANEFKGLRLTQSTKVYQKTASLNTAAIINHIKPNGPGGLEFLSVGGNPVLNSATLGYFSQGHIPKLFAQAYAPDKCFYFWDRKPPDGLDVNTFWKRLKSSGRAFVPGKSETGVFPLNFLRGCAGSFIAIGKDSLETMSLYDHANSLLLPIAPFGSGAGGTSVQPMRSRFKLTLIKNAHAIFSPDVIQARNILVGGTQIVGLLDDQAAEALEGVGTDIKANIIDASNCIITPGFVDCHVHVTGGGGELGPASRTPEGKVNEMIEGGMTTVVGVLGTDCVSRSLENLCIKCRALNDEGITAFMWTGAYRLPAPTLMGSIRRDISLIEGCIGVGECAISDHRGSQATREMITEAAMDSRVGGMLSGKAGIMYCHIGPGNGYLKPLWDVVNNTDVPISTFLPTHCERTEGLIEDSCAWLEAGGFVDITCRSINSQHAIKKFDAKGLNLNNVTVSSDSYGSLPTYDENGKLVKYASANTRALLTFLWKMYFEHQWPLEKILPLLTRNPARILRLENKGEVSIGGDADLLLMDKNTLKLKYVIAKGAVVMTPKWTHGGLFGQPPPANHTHTVPGPKKSHMKGAGQCCQ